MKLCPMRCASRSSSNAKRSFTRSGSTRPPRVFLDLRNTQAVDALKDATIAFPDEVVRQARIGRQPDNRTRVVFDLQSAGRHSVYSLYNPYRIVIDFERAAGAREVASRSRRPAGQPDRTPHSPATTACAPRHRAPVERRHQQSRRLLPVAPAWSGHLADRHRSGPWWTRPWRAGARI